jgi:hypothetical protein
MKSRIAEELAFNFRSYGRVGRMDRVQLSVAHAQLVARTAARTPEVMVKVLSGGATSAKAVSRHIDYIGRKGELVLLNDDGDALNSREAAGQLPDDWSLDMDEAGAGKRLGRGTRAKAPRLVHKLVFSMPPGTNPEKVYGAVQNFCREEFGLKHRYAMALHTDDDHPHVHVVLKATSERGKRLNIKKTHLKEWRVKFADHLRELGVPANATPRLFRAQRVRATPHALICQQAREGYRSLPVRQNRVLERTR